MLSIYNISYLNLLHNKWIKIILFIIWWKHIYLRTLWTVEIKTFSSNSTKKRKSQIFLNWTDRKGGPLDLSIVTENSISRHFQPKQGNFNDFLGLNQSKEEPENSCFSTETKKILHFWNQSKVGTIERIHRGRKFDFPSLSTKLKILRFFKTGKILRFLGPELIERGYWTYLSGQKIRLFIIFNQKKENLTIFLSLNQSKEDNWTYVSW